MKREILFKGKRLDNNEWVYGYIYERDGHYYIVTLETEVEVIPETIGQFTGLTDKNGVKIFENDIVRHDDYDFIVKYGIQEVDAFEGVGFNLWEFYGRIEDLGKAIRLQSSIEIIGNIHE